MFKKIMSAMLAVLLIGSFAGCQSQTGTHKLLPVLHDFQRRFRREGGGLQLVRRSLEERRHRAERRLRR